MDIIISKADDRIIELGAQLIFCGIEYVNNPPDEDIESAVEVVKLIQEMNQCENVKRVWLRYRYGAGEWLQIRKAVKENFPEVKVILFCPGLMWPPPESLLRLFDGDCDGDIDEIEEILRSGG